MQLQYILETNEPAEIVNSIKREIIRRRDMKQSAAGRETTQKGSARMAGSLEALEGVISFLDSISFE